VVELIYDTDCPNVEAARVRILQSFARLELAPNWREWRIGDPGLPLYAHGYGSPTILVDGSDVAGQAPSESGQFCRIYIGPDGALAGVPTVAQIAAALGGTTAGKGAVRPITSGRWRLNLAMLPGIGMAFLPKIACPACWPAYAGLLGSLGLGFLMHTAWLLPLTATFLVLAVGALAFRAWRRRGYGPFLVGLAASAVVLLGKFAFENHTAMYAGVSLLVAASFWNTWPVTAAADCACNERNFRIDL
jgi:hypothetical protein